MEISFLPGNMGVTARNSTVKFGAMVNGEMVACQISERALKTHFSAKSGLQEDLFKALEDGRERIEEAVRRRLASNPTMSALVDSADFDQ